MKIQVHTEYTVMIGSRLEDHFRLTFATKKEVKDWNNSGWNPDEGAITTVKFQQQHDKFMLIVTEIVSKY